MSGESADVSDARTVSVLRDLFAGEAAALHLPDPDAAALKLRAPGTLTQQIAGWLYWQPLSPSGVRCRSRYDDRLRMCAIFEQSGEDSTGSRRLTDQLQIELTVEAPQLLEAFDIPLTQSSAPGQSRCPAIGRVGGTSRLRGTPSGGSTHPAGSTSPPPKSALSRRVCGAPAASSGK